MQIKKIISCLCIISVALAIAMHEKHYAHRIVILDPAGDTKRTGRRIGDNFERGLTLQCAEKIKALIEEQAPYIKVIITRMPGDTVYELQNASLANRVHADLFINLNFYHTQETKPTLFLYQFSYGNDFAQCQQGLIFNSYDQAHCINKEKTDIINQLFKKELSQQKYQSLCTISGPHHAPIKPLIGIIAPGITCDIGLKNKEAWSNYSDLLAQAIINVLNTENIY